jgi:predicted hydrolase (HD superfamily)
LYASDELTGLIMAVAYVRPSKDLRDVEVSSVKKKWKDKLFAAAVNRADIEEGARELGVDTWEHVRIVLDGMKLVAADLGLDGRLAAPQGAQA